MKKETHGLISMINMGANFLNTIIITQIPKHTLKVHIEKLASKCSGKLLRIDFN